MKILTVVGARPQFIKAAVLSRNIIKHEGIEEILVHTGQHFDANMSQVFFDEMDIPKPDYYLDINSMSHGMMTGRMLEGIETILIKEKPDWVLVYGDTNSTLAGALAASKLHIPLAHVEAGLRSFNMSMPEEINRILTDRISNMLFCPTTTAVTNLHVEGFQNFDCAIHQVGDVMYDAVLYYRNKLSDKPTNLPMLPKSFILATLHRQENTHDEHRLKELVEGLNYIHQSIIPVVVPLHPGTAARIKKYGFHLNVLTTLPVGYFDMLRLLESCLAVATDSGGLQKEAYFFNKPCVTMRDQTEWTELIKAGVNTLVGANKAKLISEISNIIKITRQKQPNLYGDGMAGDRIVNYLLS